MLNVLRSFLAFFFLLIVWAALTDPPATLRSGLFPEALQGKWRLRQVLCDGEMAALTEMIHEGWIQVDWAVSGGLAEVQEKIGKCVKESRLENPILSTARLFQVLAGTTDCNRECGTISREACGEAPQIERLAFDWSASTMEVRLQKPSRFCQGPEQIATYIFERVL